MMDHKTRDTWKQQAQMLVNRVKKKYKTLRKRFARRNIDVFRLYDWDIPEIRIAVDWYAGHLVIAEYTRKQSIPQWLTFMGEALSRAMDIPLDNIHLKHRHSGFQDGKRYDRLDHTDHRLTVAEGDLKFYVNLFDYVDTGLFADHRVTRGMVRDMARGKDVLNLYCYTGAFSCYAALGGARSTTSVDRSASALNWARENMELNQIPLDAHSLVQSPTFDYLEKARQQGHLFDLAIVDPPSFSTSRDSAEHFDIAKDHPRLLRAVIERMRDSATLFFSTNHQDFRFRDKGLEISDIKEITARTIPEDYKSKRKTIHRCWQITI